jgi:hypothetical protein
MLYGNNSSYMVNVCMLVMCVVEIFRSTVFHILREGQYKW